ncbi:aggregation-promoting factor C-terminal-like domain-containing protein [Bifidobacterium vansinderenii]|uniref:Lytic transglycosylase n=1 Tax=Bifidobacterium vansinderenii TaxID=1984871 RepID=A0A229VWU6_9BIFI|nr:G5 domain-containing protein [Bifidobacterium vansinderenii]OXN00088.1 lytic transglycosylase [Bifidobacterium vansinderenii]
MARRWTPQRFQARRRIRVAACAAAVTVACMASFLVGTHKTVALEVNGKTETVQTYAMSVDRLLQEQGVDVKTHDIVTSSSGNALANHAVVKVQSAYQATITIEGKDVPFWTIATSADQLLGFFQDNENAASQVTVNIQNVYNQLTGGFVINANGPVTVVADGQSSEAPNGKLPAASILDSKGIVLGKEDRVSVEKNGDQTVLRVKRVTHGETTKTVEIPFVTQTIVDDTLQPGETVVRQQGQNGEKTQTYNTTFVDGQAESAVLLKETTTKEAVNQVVAVGPEKTEETPSDNSSSDSNSNDSNKSDNKSDSDKTDSKSDSSDKNSSDSSSSKPSSKPSSSSSSSASSKPSESASSKPSSSPSQSETSKPAETPTPTQKPTQNTNNNSSNNSGSSSNNSSSSNSGSSNSSSNSSSNNSSSNSGSSSSSGSTSGLWHASPSAAQTYARGAVAQYGWGGTNFDSLVKLWNKESGWSWSAENKSSGAYGIPQSLPGSKMATFGANWKDDAAIQINWGLSYISGRYGNPDTAWAHSQKTGWY